MSISFVCVACGKEKLAAVRSAGRQSYCGERACQQSRKTAWQKQSLADPDHRSNQRHSHQAWCRSRPDYWSEYRRRHPDKAERNRRLQARRDQRRRHPPPQSAALLAKMDALVSFKPVELPENGEFWLVPVLAKMDALRVKIVAITDT